MSFSSKNLTFAVLKAESTPGTPEFNLTSTYPADADYNSRVYGIEITPTVEFDEDVANIATGDHGELNGISGKQSIQISFSVPLNWGGAVATSPKWAKILSACGLYESAYTTTGIGYQPLKRNDQTSVSIAVFQPDLTGAAADAQALLIAGAMGNHVLTVENNGKLYANCTLTGKFADMVEVSNANIPELTAADVIVADKLINATVTLDGVTQFIAGFSLDAGNDVQPIINQADETGYLGYYIANRKPRLAISPLQLDISTYDVFSRMKLDENIPVLISTENFNLYVPRANLMSHAMTEREGLNATDQNYICMRNHDGTTALQAIPDEATFELLQGARA